MHDTDHSREHTRAAAKSGSGPETNELSALDAVDAECKAIAREQGGTYDDTDVQDAVEKGRQDLDVTSDESDRLHSNPLGTRYYERRPR